MRWAREAAEFATAKDAADALAIPEATYRTYERGPENNGRWPRLALLQRIAKRFRVSWSWLESGEGDPHGGGVLTDEDVARLADAAKVVDISKRSDAINAAVSVLESFRQKRER